MSELETPDPVAEPVAKPAAQAAALARLDSMDAAHLVSGAHFAKRPAEIVAALLEGTGIALGTVTDTPEPTISAIRFDGEPLRACLDKLARPCGATWKLSGGKVDFTFVS